MKLLKLLLIVGCFFNIQAHNSMSCKWLKEGLGPLSIQTLQELKQLFNAEIFIESGTYKGETTALAAQCFKEVHSIELDNYLYNSAAKRFKDEKNVNIYLGDSGTVLYSILPNVNKKTIFWLDAHKSGADTAHGIVPSALLQELAAIKKHGITDAIILIDDLRECRQACSNANPAVWPSLAEVLVKAREINPTYSFVVVGDIGIIYPKDEQITISPVLAACTVSRLFAEKSQYSQEEMAQVILAEEIIANAQGQERETLEKLGTIFAGHPSDDAVYALWYGLIMKAQGQYKKACQAFTRSMNIGRRSDWRAAWYLIDVASKAGDYAVAEQALQNIINLDTKLSSLFGS